MGRRQSHLLLLTLLLAAAAAAGTGWARTLTAAGTPHEDELFELVVQRLRLHTRQPMTAFGVKNLDDLRSNSELLSAPAQQGGSSEQERDSTEDSDTEDGDGSSKSTGQMGSAAVQQQHEGSLQGWLQPLLQQLAGSMRPGDGPSPGGFLTRGPGALSGATTNISSSKDPAATPAAGAELPGDLSLPGVPGGLTVTPPPISTLAGAVVVGGGNTSNITSSSNASTSSGVGNVTEDAASSTEPEKGSESWPAAIRQLGNPSCVWINDTGSCMPTQDNWLIPQGVPSSPWRRANLLAAARQRHCEQHKQEAPCWADQQFRCYWHKNRNGQTDCRSADLLEVAFFSGTGFAGTLYDIPAVMTCPGSQAERFQRCFGHPAALEHCDKLEGCFSVQQTASEPPQQGGLQASQEPSSICLPRFFADLDSKQIDEFLVMMWSLDSRVYGACAATCWMKQARSCRQLRVTARKECEAAAFCSWDRSKSRCLKKSLEFQNDSDYDYKVRRLYGLCLDIDNSEDCKITEKTKPKPSIDWKSFKDMGEPVTKCEAP